MRVCNCSAKVNHAQLVGLQDGTIVVPTYDWKTFFQPHFTSDPFKGVKKLHHLKFTSVKPGVCLIKDHSDSTEREITILKKNHQWSPHPDILPSLVEPDGLSHERKKYLFEKIREFCPAECRDLVCPDPDRVPMNERTPTPSPCFQSPPSCSSSPSPPPPEHPPRTKRCRGRQT